MEKIYRIVACLSEKGLHYDIIEVDVLKETAENYILDKHTSTGKTKRLTKRESYNVNIEPQQQIHIIATTWAFATDINLAKTMIREKIEKQLGSDQAFYQRRAKMSSDMAELLKTAPTTFKNRIEKDER